MQRDKKKKKKEESLEFFSLGVLLYVSEKYLMQMTRIEVTPNLFLPKRGMQVR